MGDNPAYSHLLEGGAIFTILGEGVRGSILLSDLATKLGDAGGLNLSKAVNTLRIISPEAGSFAWNKKRSPFPLTTQPRRRIDRIDGYQGWWKENAQNIAKSLLNEQGIDVLNAFFAYYELKEPVLSKGLVDDTNVQIIAAKLNELTFSKYTTLRFIFGQFLDDIREKAIDDLQRAGIHIERVKGTCDYVTLPDENGVSNIRVQKDDATEEFYPTHYVDFGIGQLPHFRDTDSGDLSTDNGYFDGMYGPAVGHDNNSRFELLYQSIEDKYSSSSGTRVPIHIVGTGPAAMDVLFALYIKAASDVEFRKKFTVNIVTKAEDHPKAQFKKLYEALGVLDSSCVGSIDYGKEAGDVSFQKGKLHFLLKGGEETKEKETSIYIQCGAHQQESKNLKHTSFDDGAALTTKKAREQSTEWLIEMAAIAQLQVVDLIAKYPDDQDLLEVKLAEIIDKWQRIVFKSRGLLEKFYSSPPKDVGLESVIKQKGFIDSVKEKLKAIIKPISEDQLNVSHAEAEKIYRLCLYGVDRELIEHLKDVLSPLTERGYQQNLVDDLAEFFACVAAGVTHEQELFPALSDEDIDQALLQLKSLMLHGSDHQLYKFYKTTSPQKDQLVEVEIYELEPDSLSGAKRIGGDKQLTRNA